MDWSWAVEGITEETPRTTGPECINYMTNFRRWIESVLFTILFLCIIKWTMDRMKPIVLPPACEINRAHSAVRLLLMLAMTFVFGIEMGFKFAGKSVINVLNPCHIQTVVQIYLLAAKPSKTTIALFRIQMNNLNGPFLAFLFPEVECRTFPFEQATYWIQHALLYIIPVYILKSGAYKMEDINDYNWNTIGVMIMLIYHFVILSPLSIHTGINLNHMLCAALSDPFQGQNYRIAAVIHESILCPILNKLTVLMFSSDNNSSSSSNNISSKSTKMPSELYLINNSTNQIEYDSVQYEQAKIPYAFEPQGSVIAPTEQQLAEEEHELVEEEELNSSSTATPIPMLITDTEMSLAAEMAAAMSEPYDSGALLKRRHIARHSIAETTLMRAKDGSPEHNARQTEAINSVAAAYTMPTTKID